LDKTGSSNRPTPYKCAGPVTRRRTGLAKKASIDVDLVVFKITNNSDVHGFVGLVRALRSSQQFIQNFKGLDGQDIFQTVSKLSVLAEQFRGAAHASTFCKYVALIRMVDALDRTKGGRLRVDRMEYKTILERQGPNANKERLANQVKLGNSMKKALGPFKGVLCWAVLAGEATRLLEISRNAVSLGAFHCLLQDDRYKTLWKAGENLYEMVGGSDLSFRFERQECPLDGLRREDVITLLELDYGTTERAEEMLIVQVPALQ